MDVLGGFDMRFAVPCVRAVVPCQMECKQVGGCAVSGFFNSGLKEKDGKTNQNIF